jgi:hypothetical protein|nr:MAG TPA: DNA double-strand break repair protein [Bacteriophage sp.]
MKIENIEIPNLGISKRFDRVTWLTDDKDRDILIDAVKKSISFVLSSDRRICEEELHSVSSGQGPSMMMDKIGEDDLNKYGGTVDINVSADFAGGKFNWRIYKNPPKNKGYPEFSKYMEALRFLSDKFESGYDYPVIKVYDNGFPNLWGPKRYKEYLTDDRRYILTEGYPPRNYGYHWWSEGSSPIFFWGFRLFHSLMWNKSSLLRIPGSIDNESRDKFPILKEGNLIINRIGIFLRMVEQTIKPLFLTASGDGDYLNKFYICTENKNGGIWLNYNIMDLPGNGLGKAVYLVMDLTYRELFLESKGYDERKISGGIVVLEDFLVDLHPERRRKMIEAITKVFSNIQFIIK